MAFVQNTRSRVHTCATAHYRCCNVTAIFFLVFGAALIGTGGSLVHNYKDGFYEHANKPSWPSYPDWDRDYDYGDHYGRYENDDLYNSDRILYLSGVGLLCFGVLFVVIGGICLSCACCSRNAANTDGELSAEPLQQAPYEPQPPYPPQPQYQAQPQYPLQPQNPPPAAPPLPYPQQPPSYDQVVGSQQLPAHPNIPPTAPSAPAADEIKKTAYK